MISCKRKRGRTWLGFYGLLAGDEPELDEVVELVAAGLLSPPLVELASDFEGVAASEAGLASPSLAAGLSVAAAPFFLLESLKSVTYQPLPFRIKPVLDMSLTIGPWLQDRHDSGAGSEIFCIISLTVPQDWHWYS